MSSVSFSPSYPLFFLKPPSYGEQAKRVFWTTYDLGMEKTRVISVEILKLTIMVTTVIAVAACVFSVGRYAAVSFLNLTSTYISLEELPLAENRNVAFFTELSILVRLAAYAMVLFVDTFVALLSVSALMLLSIKPAKKIFSITQDTYNEVKIKRNRIALALGSEKGKKEIVILLNQLKKEIIPQIETQLEEGIIKKEILEEKIIQISIFLNYVLDAPLFKENEKLFLDFMCPITLALPTIPMRNEHAKKTYYDKIAILTWLKMNSTCPSTINPLRENDLTYDLTPFNEVVSILLSNLPSLE